MKKLALDDLRVESYASQVSEQELAEVKGGTALPCAYLIVEGIAAAAAVVGAGIAAYSAYNNNRNNGSSGGGGENTTIYYPDSVKVYPDGSQTIYYPDSVKMYHN